MSVSSTSVDIFFSFCLLYVYFVHFLPFHLCFTSPLACFLYFTSFIPPCFPFPSPLFIPHFCFFISVFCFLPLVSLCLLPLVLFVFLSPPYFFHQNQYKIGFLRSILFYFHNAYWPLVSTKSSLNDFVFLFPVFGSQIWKYSDQMETGWILTLTSSIFSCLQRKNNYKSEQVTSTGKCALISKDIKDTGHIFRMRVIDKQRDRQCSNTDLLIK